ncbi:MAG: bifunctional phosphoribosylaminoimidazolecarboxamide formyltransferase/IMP cyclohydrolase [Solirubrobacteraceae bacterium]
MTQPGDVRVRRALLSVSDKRGVADFARGLAELGVELVSTGGTARELADAGLEVRAIEDFTGFPEIMGGRVKTLHPKLYAGLLALRDDVEHMIAAETHGIELVDLVCVNLYPFERTAARRGATDHEVIENIDVGGPTMIRAAAKNYGFTAVVTRPESYDAVLQELEDAEGRLSLGTRESLAAEAFSCTARYDTAIARWFAEKREDFPPLLMSAYEKVTDLAYGENPHQRAAYYAQVGARMHVLSMVKQVAGKDLSFNNVLDLNSGRLLVEEFSVPACAIIKHNNPCGAAIGSSARQAYERAFACDPQSAFGGVVCLNRPVDHALAELLVSQFCELLFAPRFTDEALALLESKPSMRILEDNERRRFNIAERDLKRVMGGLLVQDRDIDLEDRSAMEVVTERKPTEAAWGEMLFGWKVCKHVRSNAIVLSRELASVGIGAGQMSRVDSVRLAVDKAREAGSELHGAALASDAFFPFPDGPQLAVEAGVTSIIQPGGSKRDLEVVEAADAAGISMVFTHRRHFKH